MGSEIEVDGTTYILFSGPKLIPGADVQDILDITRNRRRAEYLISAAEAFADVDELVLRHGEYEEAAAWLDAIDEIGPWYA